jgi:hypothetical protein
VIQDVLEIASHVHPACVVTVRVPLPPEAVGVTLPGVTV